MLLKIDASLGISKIIWGQFWFVIFTHMRTNYDKNYGHDMKNMNN